MSQRRFPAFFIARIPEDKLGVLCRVGFAEPVPLSKLLVAYIEHCQDMVAQILEPLDWWLYHARYRTDRTTRIVAHFSRLREPQLTPMSVECRIEI